MEQSARNGISARNGNGKSARPRVTELPKITVHSDTRDILAHAARDRDAAPEDYFIVDVDAHVTETAFWSDVTDRIDNDVFRQMAKSFRDRVGSPPGRLTPAPGRASRGVNAPIPHQRRRGEPVPDGPTHRQVTLIRRAMDAM